MFTHEDKILPGVIGSGLTTVAFGRQIAYFPCTDSTNHQARLLAEKGAPEGTLVITEEQTAGRGRLGRRWLSPPGVSLLFSLIFRPNLEPARVQGLTIVCGLAVRAAIRDLTNLPVQLKWPNDIVLHDRKLGGILTEFASIGSQVDYVVVGIGLNVNMGPAGLPPKVSSTSLSIELGHSVPRAALLQRILEAVEVRHAVLCAGYWPVQEWSEALDTLGRHITLSTDEGLIEGIAEAVDDRGGLLVRLPSGTTVVVLVGDIIPHP